MAAGRYRRFLKLCEEWPVDETKRGRDLGAYLRQRVAQAFREGENSKVQEPEVCDEMYESLARLHSNYYKHKYPRPRETSFSGLSLEEYKLILSTDALDWETLPGPFGGRVCLTQGPLQLCHHLCLLSESPLGVLRDSVVPGREPRPLACSHRRPHRHLFLSAR
ncbi:ubiquinol-cytochrome-c reductase complex assembly factor 2 isoform X1 [Sorex araneus]|uniref:ubiquinol-cytochrome-c reductase complex assembly factor 2 isoform X1 n=1 Tax=Sorex araneus TaxID=42254 RepID=UPI002433655C|nr:ubiquinol-cytochrome-c reductase complex assembly factor 2 isoform X1 [Sorex araneus]